VAGVTDASFGGLADGILTAARKEHDEEAWRRGLLATPKDGQRDLALALLRHDLHGARLTRRKLRSMFGWDPLRVAPHSSVDERAERGQG
jgi:hypothetical protein